MQKIIVMKIYINIISSLHIRTAIFLLAIASLCPNIAAAQLNPFGTAYFQNQYQFNPAMAGVDTGLVFNGGYRQQWSSIPGTPKTQSFTIEYGSAEKKFGVGINLNNDRAGLQLRTRVIGTFAYYLPINERNRLSFGISLGYMDDRIENIDLKGDMNDASINEYNQRDKYIDGDFGLAYNTDRLTLQGAIPNLKNFFQNDGNEVLGVDYATFMASASYRIGFEEALDGLVIEPKACFRGIHGYDNIVDLGANFNFAKKRVNVLGMYHTSKSATFGMGVVYNRLSVMGLYTTETAALRSYANGTFELGLKFRAL